MIVLNDQLQNHLIESCDDSVVVGDHKDAVLLEPELPVEPHQPLRLMHRRALKCGEKSIKAKAQWGTQTRIPVTMVMLLMAYTVTIGLIGYSLGYNHANHCNDFHSSGFSLSQGQHRVQWMLKVCIVILLMYNIMCLSQQQKHHGDQSHGGISTSAKPICDKTLECKTLKNNKIVLGEEYSPTTNEATNYTDRIFSSDKAEGQNLEMKQRQRIQRALGSIHAPCMPTPYRTHKARKLVADINIWNEYLTQWTAFTECQAGLMKDMELATSILRSVSSVRMGLGPLSPAVERVETQSASVSISTPPPSNVFGSIMANSTHQRTLGGARMRRILFESMQRQRNTLCNILDKMLSHIAKNTRQSSKHTSCGAQIHDIIQFHLQQDELFLRNSQLLPPALTLHLLKTCLNSNKELLSSLLAMSLDSEVFNQIISNDGSGSSSGDWNPIDLLRQSLREAAEEKVYLQSSFSLNDFHESNHATNGKMNDYETNRVPNCMVEIQKHFEASYAILVTFVQSWPSKFTSDAVEGSSEETRALFQDLCCSLQKVFHLCRSSKASLFPMINNDENEDGADETDLPGVEIDSNIKKSDIVEYDDDGRPDLATHLGLNEDDRIRKNKTIVFSGKGSKLPFGLSRNNNDKFKPRIYPREPILIDRSVLIQELQSRLVKIDLPEECEMDVSHNFALGIEQEHSGFSESHNKFGRNHQVTSDVKRSKPFSTGLSGTILMELKGAIAEKAQDDDIISSDDQRLSGTNSAWINGE